MSEQQVVRASHGEKAETVAAVHQRLKSAKLAIVTEYRGMSVAQMTRLRREIRDASGEYQVIKNTLVRRALKDTSFDELEKLLQGPNGWVFAYDDPVVLSKAIIKFADDTDKLRIKGESPVADAEQAGATGQVAGADQRTGDPVGSLDSGTGRKGCPIARIRP
jgi:large subunit ribosomal protein L10